MVQPLVHSLPGFIARTVTSAASTSLTSMEGIDARVLEDGATCFVREQPLGTALNALFRYDSSSARTPSSTVVNASGGGQWLQIATRVFQELKSIRTVPGSLTEPTPIEAGATMGWGFAIGDLGYQEFGLHPLVDRSLPIILGLGWAPTGAEAAKTVSWQFDICQAGIGKNVALIDTTKAAANVPCPAAAAIYQHSGVTLTPAEWGGPDTVVDELHIRIQRIAASADPAAPPGGHHLVCIQPLL